jgi:hypothetical protein
MPEPEAQQPAQNQAIGTASNQTISFLVTAMRNGSIVPQPPFQRRLVWTPKHKAEFLDTVLKGYPFPEIYLANGEVDVDTGKTTQLLVDGQQRMTTLRGYMDNSEDLKLPSAFIRYKSLSDTQKRTFLNYKVAVRDLGNLSRPEIVEIFRRINQTQYSLNEMEKLNAVYSGELKAFSLELADHPFFQSHGVFTIADRRRMRDLSFALTLTISALFGYFRRDEEHEAYLETFNSTFPDRETFKLQLEHLFETVNACNFPNSHRVWNQTELLNLLVELHATVYKDDVTINPQEICGRLHAFYNAVDAMNDALPNTEVAQNDEAPTGHDPDVFRYLKAATSRASSDKYTRVTRGDVIRKVITGAWPTGQAPAGAATA